MASIRSFIDYLFGKRSEVKDMSAKDAMLAKVILDIHRKRTHTKFIRVPLFSLHQIHRLDRDNAMESLKKRIALLEENKDEIAELKSLSCDDLNHYLPSVSAIKVVQESVDSYIAYEGNGRLAALREIFSEAEGIELEVENYVFENPAKIIRRMNRVRKMNDLSF
ncbi:MAG: hypothetical protein VCD00_02625 [Candidatus Hydrogenedentota bacterium]